MCGIFLFIKKYGYKVSRDIIDKSFQKIQSRGPDNSQLINFHDLYFGFHRLSIMDTSNLGNQPFYMKNIILICNGEIFNYKQIIKHYNIKTKSSSDCEVLLHLYVILKNEYENEEKAIYEMCNILDGEFSFCLYDLISNKVFIARDPYGVRPLFFSHDALKYISFASEMKGLYDLSKDNESQIRQFKPGHYMIFDNNKKTITSYSKYKTNLLKITNYIENEIFAMKCINEVFKQAVHKRIMADREVCCLLSGGLDSSIVASIVSRYMKENFNTKIKTFSIGMSGSPDLKYAQIVANHIDSEHHNIEISENDFLNAIEETIYAIESYDITTVRASVGNYLVSKYIKENTDCVVVFNGDYSDEVMGGYIYMNLCKDENEFNKETYRLVNDITYFDSLRSDRSISNNGLEARVPFADKDFLRLMFTIHPKLKMGCNRNNVEKYLFRKSFDNDNLLPKEILWRKKEAFSDGVSKQEKSWFSILQDYINDKISDQEFNHCKNNYKINPPKTKEAYYYRTIFERFYQNTSQVIPYFWMPKYTNATDPSARTLNNY